MGMLLYFWGHLVSHRAGILLECIYFVFKTYFLLLCPIEIVLWTSTTQLRLFTTKFKISIVQLMSRDFLHFSLINFRTPSSFPAIVAQPSHLCPMHFLGLAFLYKLCIECIRYCFRIHRFYFFDCKKFVTNHHFFFLQQIIVTFPKHRLSRPLLQNGHSMFYVSVYTVFHSITTQINQFILYLRRQISRIFFTLYMLFSLFIVSSILTGIKTSKIPSCCSFPVETKSYLHRRLWSRRLSP